MSTRESDHAPGGELTMLAEVGPSPRSSSPSDPAADLLPTLDEAVSNHRDYVLPPVDAWHKRIWKQRKLMHHNRLVFAVLALNIGYAVWWAIGRADQPLGGLLSAESVRLASYAVLANFTLTALVRQQRMINLFFKVATAAPKSWPLRIRWTLGKVYHFGGLHVGGALGTTAWFVCIAVLTIAAGTAALVVQIVTAVIGVFLLGMLATAMPRFRAKFHDRFEVIHRFAGWTALGLFGLHSVLVVVTSERGDQSLLSALVTSPAVWVFLIVAASVSSTWWDLRLVPVDFERPSRHVVIAKFHHRSTFAGSSTALSRRPLREWHHFANVHTPGDDGFRLTISRAGDWTGALIDDLPEKVWVKGIPAAGVGNIDALFSKVLWVATGSGIGPCLPHLLSGDTPAGLVWSTRDPVHTYGVGLVSEILEVQPEATIWDTTKLGKPDLIRLAFAAQERVQAEAVICISNKPTTWSIVEAFEQRGIPAYGAIWDS